MTPECDRSSPIRYSRSITSRHCYHLSQVNEVFSAQNLYDNVRAVAKPSLPVFGHPFSPLLYRFMAVFDGWVFQLLPKYLSSINDLVHGLSTRCYIGLPYLAVWFLLPEETTHLPSGSEFLICTWCPCLPECKCSPFNAFCSNALNITFLKIRCQHLRVVLSTNLGLSR